jgi:hypothetical protein
MHTGRQARMYARTHAPCARAHARTRTRAHAPRDTQRCDTPIWFKDPLLPRRLVVNMLTIGNPLRVRGAGPRELNILQCISFQLVSIVVEQRAQLRFACVGD